MGSNILRSGNVNEATISLPIYMPTIFLLQDGNGLVEMAQEPYESEDLLQKLLETYPSVLAGDQFSGPEPKRWLLVRRETGVPAQDTGPDRWSLDHLFVDQYGVPTLVEVKRSSDTRIRREVIGQMFDYAANAVVYWPAGRIRSLYEASCEAAETDPKERLIEFLRPSGEDDDGAADRFWNNVDTNLRAGRIRIVFVADAIAPELRRIVEFLNGQMNPAEVLAIEIKQFTGSGVKTLVPTVIGQTAQAEAKREGLGPAAKQWDMTSFLEALRKNKGNLACDIAQDIFHWSDTALPTVWWGTGKEQGSCYRGLTQNRKRYYLLAIWTYGKVEVSFYNLKEYAPFDSEAARLELLHRINEIPEVKFKPEVISRRPAFDLELLSKPEAKKAFYDAMQWAAAQIEKDTFASIPDKIAN